MSLSSYCRNCGAPAQTTEDLSALHCTQCEEARKTAITTFTEKNPESNQGERLYAGRLALIQRASHPRRTFINPRDYGRFDRPGQ